MGWLLQYALFFLKLVTVLALLSLTFVGLLSLMSAIKEKAKKPRVSIEKLNDHYNDLRQMLRRAVLSKKEYKKAIKIQRKTEKGKKNTDKKRVFVLNFDGDIKASAVKELRHSITAVLTIVRPNDEVVLLLESAGGMVPHYGLAAAQLHRLRQRDISLTVIIDKYAASGGYLMACVAQKILAAPFAIVGSIGVFVQVPNLYHWLKQKNINVEHVMAGRYKRTLTVLGENTKSGRTKAQDEVNDLHQLFKQFILDHRNNLDLEKIATGEHWYGKQALELNLVDDLITSDDYLLEASEHSDIYEVTGISKRSLSDKLASKTIKLLAPLQSHLAMLPILPSHISNEDT